MTRIIKVGKDWVDADGTLMELDRADAEESLAAFVAMAWPVIEVGNPYVRNWHIDAICQHLEAITESLSSGSGYNRLLINVPPGMSKSILLNVFWPAWEWGPKRMPYLRYICATHSLERLGRRDSRKMRMLVESEWYRKRWPHVVLTRTTDDKFETSATGFREVTAAGSITGVRGDRVLIDDPISVVGAESEAERDGVGFWFREAVPLRVNNPKKSAIVVIMQRLHADDVSGIILDQPELGYDHLMLPMEYDPSRAFPTRLGFEDPRTEENELLFPERFPPDAVERDKVSLGPYGVAGQFQQTPSPRGGGILKREWWNPWEGKTYPPFSLIVASLDTAFTTKESNDASALTVWGLFQGARAVLPADNWNTPGGRFESHDKAAQRFDEMRTLRASDGTGDIPSLMLAFAFEVREELQGLVKRTVETCRKYKVDKLLIENKSRGHDVAKELKRQFAYEQFQIQMIEPKADKVARVHAIVPIFSEGAIWAPDRPWADKVIDQCSKFPKDKHDDLVDTVSQAIGWFRQQGLLVRSSEWAEDMRSGMSMGKNRNPAPLYPGS